jgi:hypothetical protein
MTHEYAPNAYGGEAGAGGAHAARTRATRTHAARHVARPSGAARTAEVHRKVITDQGRS